MQDPSRSTSRLAKVADTTNGLKADSLYLTSGDFRTQLGSIASAQDLEAGRAVKIKSLEGHGEGPAELVYSHTAREKFAAKTLYLKDGDFKTQKGSIRAGDTLHTWALPQTRSQGGLWDWFWAVVVQWQWQRGHLPTYGVPRFGSMFYE